VRAPAVHAGPVWGPRLQTASVLAAAALLAVVAGMEVAEGGDRLTPPLLGLVALAGAALLFSIPPDKLFLGWLLLAPLLQNSADESAIGRPLSFALYAAPAVVLAVLTLANWRRRSDGGLVDLFPAAYVVYVFLSIAITTTLLQDELFGTGKVLFMTTALGAVVYYFLVFGPGRSIAAERIARVLLLGALGQAILALVEWGSGWNLWGTSPWQYSDPPRAVATLVSPPALGVFLGCGIVLALAVIAWAGPVELRRLSWLVVVLGLPALLVTYTRAPIVATAVVALGVLLLARSARLVALGAVAVMALALVAVWPQLSASKLYETRIAESTNIAGRADIQDISLKAAKAKPLTGWGYGSFDTAKVAEGASVDLRVQAALATSSHNGFLTVLVELGGIGLALLLVPWVVIVVRGIGAIRRPTPERWFAVACVAAVAVFALTASANDLRFFSIVYALPLLFLGLLRRSGSGGGEPFTS